MRILGAVLAGGKSSRFGSDKAEALLDGRPLLDHALHQLRLHADEVAVVGRRYASVISVEDRPAPGLGPLGGMCGALAYAADNGFDWVLTCSVDCPHFPADLLQEAPCYLEAQPVIGLWPSHAAAALLHFIKNDDRRSVRRFAKSIHAIAVQTDFAPPNINTPADLAALEARQH